MFYDFQTPVTLRDGSPMRAMESSENPATMGSVCIAALDSFDMAQGGERISGDEKRRRGHLADRIYGAKEPISLVVEEVALLKSVVDKYILGSLVVTRVSDFLEHPLPELKDPTPKIPSDKSDKKD